MVLLIGSRAADAALLFGPHAKIAEVDTDRVRVSGAINVEAGVGAIRDAFGDAVEIQVDKSALPAVAAPVEAEEAPEQEPSTAPVEETTVSVRFYGTEQVDVARSFRRATAGLISFREPPTEWDGDVWVIRGTTTDAAALKRATQQFADPGVVLYLDGKIAVGRAPRN